MNNLLKLLTLAIAINVGMFFFPQKMKAQEVSVSFQVFYDDLSPYGTWVDNPEYGYVWYPNEGGGFAPYSSNGYWVLTNYGWTWVSNYSWGWAPFHYGRWYTDPMYGPMWIPGNEWGPGWVTWRQSDGYYGWAPIGPGISLEMAYSDSYTVQNDHWHFVHSRDFGRTNYNNYYVDNSTNVTIIQNSSVINNTYVDGRRKSSYNSGPKREDVEKRAGKAFAPVAIKESFKPEQKSNKGEMNLYRPAIQKSDGKDKKIAPAKVHSIKEVKTQEQRNGGAESKKENNRVEQKKEQPRQQPAKQKERIEPAKQQPLQPKQPRGEQQQKTEPPQNKPQQHQENNVPVKQQPERPKQQPREQQQKPKVNKQQPEQSNPKPQEPRNDRPQGKPQPEQRQHKPEPNKQQPQPGNQQPMKQPQPPKQQPPKPHDQLK